ncbi:MAG: ATP-binding cassette domain-containing protein [Clostridia bacterium]|nr:ATP-binding cassette domain-containing protein [Clostridia bacterium]
MEEKKVLLSVQDLVVKFRVRGRILTAIRDISLDIYENESIAIVGESGSGKSVFTKTFAGMLDGNGFIDQGDIFFTDDELADTTVMLDNGARASIRRAQEKLIQNARLLKGADVYHQMEALQAEKRSRTTMSEEEADKWDTEIGDLVFKRTELFNLKQTFDTSKEKDKIKAAAAEISALDAKVKERQAARAARVKELKAAAQADTAWQNDWNQRMAVLKAQYEKDIAQSVSPETEKQCARVAREMYLSVGRYRATKRVRALRQLQEEMKKAMTKGIDLSDDTALNNAFDPVTFRVKLLDESNEKLHGVCAVNLAKIRDNGDWTQIRGRRIATVFQDPMTSLNPIITIGKQITSIIIKHQHCSEVEARERAVILMKKVGIPNAEKRFDDYPFQYSGGMRQRIVIAIALSCQPKILICDEPTTALDVTIQAQILKLLKDLQREFDYTIVFITHDLGVVANVADRVAVMYAGQIVEVGQVEEVFYDPRHPYTWALLSSLPQLAQKDKPLYSITGTPPSLYNKIVGDPFAPRNPYCMKIDTLKEPPMFRVTDTHYAKTWLEDPRSPKVKKPEIIENIHEKLLEAFNI